MPDLLHLLYGTPPADLAATPADARQCSPLIPGAAALDEIAPASAASMTMVVPPGTIERRHALALALRALAPGGRLVALGPKDKGGSRIRKELEGFDCAVAEESKKHWRLCRATRPETLESLDGAIAEGAPRHDPALELRTQPGIFSWDRIDEGTALLLEALGPLSGHGADLGSGLGIIGRAVLERNRAVDALDCVELDARAIAAARHNVPDPRARFHWRDVRDGLPFSGLDFVVMNPPFHSGGQDDVGLGLAFLRQAKAALRKGGVLWLVANRHLPYEADLATLFTKREAIAQSARFKVVRAVA